MSRPLAYARGTVYLIRRVARRKDRTGRDERFVRRTGSRWDSTCNRGSQYGASPPARGHSRRSRAARNMWPCCILERRCNVGVGMGMQRVDAERMERLEPSPL